MSAISLQNVCKQFGLQFVLRNVSIELQSNQITGLVGNNGSGKTTLIKLINRDLTPDTGTVTCERGLEIGLLTQEPDVSLERTLHDEVASVFEGLLATEARMHALSDEMAALHDDPRLPQLMEKYERVNAEFITAGGHTFEARLHEILGGLGFSPADYDKPVSILSGGQKCRAALAKLLLSNSAYLLLDEPTNHLDIDATRWLEKFLVAHNSGALIISHDRYLLDRVCDRIVEVEQTRVTAYPGNYTNYVKTRDVRMLTQQRQFEKDSEFIEKERAFIAKHIAGQRTKEAQGRRSRLDRRLAAGEFVTELPAKNRRARISFAEVAEQVGVVVRGEELAMSYGENKLFADLNFMAHASRCFGITGPNGCGKTTLLKIILDEIEPLAGEVKRDEELRIGYYGQEHVELDPQRSVLDEIRSNSAGMSKQEARDLLARFLFRGDDVFKPLGKLSGGEQSRMRLLKLILESPDMLILDEPTNHLDIRSCEALEEALKEFPGTIIAVSHDRYFLDRLVDQLLVMRPGGCATYEGNYSYYLEQVEQAGTRGKLGAAGSRKRSKRKTKPRGTPKTAPSPYDLLSVEELEGLVMKHETDLAALHERFGEPAVYQNPDLLAELREQAEQVERDLAAVDVAWQQRVDSQ